METKSRAKPSRLRREILALARDMRASGTMNDDDYRKITLRDLRRTGATDGSAYPPLTGDDIRALRAEAQMSQAVFARRLNLTAVYVSQLERGVRRPTGAALALLDVIRRKGIEAIL